MALNDHFHEIRKQESENLLNHELVVRAKFFAIGAHSDQKRSHGSNDNYFEHPRRVAERVSRVEGAIPEMVAAAYLHDVVEDTSISLFTISKEFGRKVAKLVAYLTNEFTKEAYPALNRKERKRREIRRLGIIPIEAKVIKIIDRIDNLRDMPDIDRDFLEVYLEESAILHFVMYHNLDAFSEESPFPYWEPARLIHELRFVIDEMRRNMEET